MRVVNIGGGLPARYLQTDQVPSVQEYVEALLARVPQLFSGDYRLVIEPGRAIQAPCGLAISRVEYVKRVGKRWIAVLHLGADLFLRPVYRPEDWQHEFFALDFMGRPIELGSPHPWTLAGPLCFAGDILARDVMLPELRQDDIVVVRDCGAYTLGLWSHHCSRPMPGILGYDSGHLSLLRSHERPEDVVTFWRGR